MLTSDWDGFEIAVRAVLGQQITVRAATQLTSRLVASLGTEVAEQCGPIGLNAAFPHPERFTYNALANLGMTTARAMCLASLGEAALADGHLFDPRRDLSDAVAHLRKLAGIGEWTAQYIAMRGLGESDAFLASDAALQRHRAEFGRRLSTEKLLGRAEHWRPWRAYATVHLWMADADAAHDSQTEEPYKALTA